MYCPLWFTINYDIVEFGFFCNYPNEREPLQRRLTKVKVSHRGCVNNGVIDLFLRSEVVESIRSVPININAYVACEYSALMCTNIIQEH